MIANAHIHAPLCLDACDCDFVYVTWVMAMIVMYRYDDFY